MTRRDVKGSFVTTDRALARRVIQPLRDFMDLEAAGGIALVIATAIALIWANSPWKGAYDTFWHTEVAFRVGSYEITESLQHWVNDGLMTLFFFVVGLEIKRELVTGELNSSRKALFPVAGALGGMVVPALIFAVLNAGDRGSAGWGIPMATDIAFALGVLTLVGSRCHPSMKVFLLSLAIVDDIGAILVIALFYSGGIDLVPLAVAAAGIGLTLVMRAADVWWTPAYVFIGLATWFATLESGVHATIAGVAFGLLAPALPFREDVDLNTDSELSPARARQLQLKTHAAIPVTDRLTHLLHPWTSFLVVPIFALANAGVALSSDSIGDAVSSSLGLGIIFGLVGGKLLGITGFAWLATKLRIASLPPGADWRQLAGVAAVAGIGFTVSLFITALAFSEPDLVEGSKVAILIASALATIVGMGILRSVPPARGGPKKMNV